MERIWFLHGARSISGYLIMVCIQPEHYISQKLRFSKKLHMPHLSSNPSFTVTVFM